MPLISALGCSMITKIPESDIGVNLKIRKAKQTATGSLLIVVHLRGRGRWISEFEASLVYRVSSRTAKTTQKSPVSERKERFIIMYAVFCLHVCLQARRGHQISSL